MGGKRLNLKDVEPQIKEPPVQEKQRELYLGYIKGLREKAKVSVDEKAVETLASSLSVTATLQMQQRARAGGEEGREKGGRHEEIMAMRRSPCDLCTAQPR